MMGDAREQAIQRLKTKVMVIAPRGCWLWVGDFDSDGYGRVSYEGHTERAHRALFMAFHGDIGLGLEVDHLCGNRACVNPAHLEAIPHEENIRRRDRTRLAQEIQEKRQSRAT